MAGFAPARAAAVNRRLGGGVKGFDFRPFEADHIESELEAARGVARMFCEPGFEARAEVAHGEGARGAIDEVVLGEGVEAAIAEDGAETGKIVGKGVENAEPVLAIVDFEALEGSEAIIGLDDSLGDGGHFFAAGSDAAHAVGGRERGHDGASDLGAESVRSFIQPPRERRWRDICRP